MSCVQCRRAVPLNKCPETLVIGTIAPDTAVLGYIKKISNSATKFFSVTSAHDGKVSVDVSDWTDFLNTSKTDFEIWLTLTTALTFEDRLPITIGDVTADCLLMRFEGQCAPVIEASQTLEIAE